MYCNGYIFFQSPYRQTTTLTSRMSSKVARRNQRRRSKIPPSQKRPPLKRPLTTWERALPWLPSKNRIQLPRPRSTTPWRPPLKVSWGRRGRSRARARSNRSSLHLTSWDQSLALTAAAGARSFPTRPTNDCRRLLSVSPVGGAFSQSPPLPWGSWGVLRPLTGEKENVAHFRNATASGLQSSVTK